MATLAAEWLPRLKPWVADLRRSQPLVGNGVAMLMGAVGPMLGPMVDQLAGGDPEELDALLVKIARTVAAQLSDDHPAIIVGPDPLECGYYDELSAVPLVGPGWDLSSS